MAYINCITVCILLILIAPTIPNGAYAKQDGSVGKIDLAIGIRESRSIVDTLKSSLQDSKTRQKRHKKRRTTTPAFYIGLD